EAVKDEASRRSLISLLRSLGIEARRFRVDLESQWTRATTNGEHVRTGRTREPTSPVMSITDWADLGIGIDFGETMRYYAFSPCPGYGEKVSLSRGIPLELRGKRWYKVLKCFGGSTDGKTARLKDLITELKYAPRGNVSQLEAEGLHETN